MGDIRVQFVSKLIPSVTASVNATSGAGDFDAIVDVTKALLVSASSRANTAGNGRASGAMNNSFLSICATATIVDANTITFSDGDATIARSNQCGIWLLEYLGRAGGPNEIAVRGAVDIVLAAGVDATKDSAAIAGITSLAQCVPFATVRSTNNNSNFQPNFARIDIVNDGVNNVVRVLRDGTTGDMTVRAYVAEFGSAWSVQKVNRTFVAAATNEATAITSVGNVANAFTYATMRPSSPSRPDSMNFLAWLDSAISVSHRISYIEAADKQDSSTFIISHPDLVVTRYSNGAFSTPAGTDDITSDSSNALQTVDVAISPVKGYSTDQAMVVAYLGSNATITTANPCVLWMSWLTSDSNLRHQRSTNQGGTESVSQVIDFSNINTLPAPMMAARRPGLSPLLRM